MLIGAVGSLLACLTVPLLDKFKIDDVVGAIPVHLVAGIFGTLAVAFNTRSEVDGVVLSFGQQLGVQAIGVLATAAFVSLVSAVLWFALKATIGVRPSAEVEIAGLDIEEVGVPAYAEFITT